MEMYRSIEEASTIEEKISVTKYDIKRKKRSLAASLILFVCIIYASLSRRFYVEGINFYVNIVLIFNIMLLINIEFKGIRKSKIKLANYMLSIDCNNGATKKELVDNLSHLDNLIEIDKIIFLFFIDVTVFAAAINFYIKEPNLAKLLAATGTALGAVVLLKLINTVKKIRSKNNGQTKNNSEDQKSED